MIHVGQTIENQVTGERLTFREPAASTHGEYVLVECAVRPGGVVAAAHLHPHQTERFEVLEGTIGMKVGRETIVAGPGDVVVVEPGTPPFRLAVIAQAHFDDVRLPFPPVFMQRAGLALGAPFGRELGFRPTYEPAAPRADLAPAR